MSRWPKRTLRERFEKKFIPVTESGCWIWTGALTKQTTGYGILYVSIGKVKCAHVVSYELYKGEVPEGEGFHGICVLHSCDTQECVNPAHLRLGTQQENIQDCVKKGRHVSPITKLYGEKSRVAKLSNEQVQEIKRIGKSKTQREIAGLFNVSQQHICDILNGRYRKNG